ncbi:MAG: hypothetical protein J0I47_14830 [Sphingomonas sp.]|uniref:hypothetical protein n=1 Tax=Sphingomonas sp. TaxID=28214 RepID=UPI001AD07893|nr:hypothetical protein [Sphingomonas sp.]MBN8809491.1 hypothetical protein [Sphingomonas sp.]
MRTLPLVLILPLLAGGCLGTVGTIVTAPVRVTSKVVDWTTTSQSEADRNRGRKMRKQEERETRERRKADAACRRHPADCDPYDGNRPTD